MGANNSVPANYSAAAYAVLTIDIILTTSAVVGRTVSRRLMKATPATDDYLCYFAYTANLGLLISGYLLNAFGALDLADVSIQSDEEKRFVRAAYNSLAILYIFSMTFIKLSILFLFRRTFTMFYAWFRWAWWILLSIILSWTTTCIILVALQGAGKMPKSGFSRLGISTTGVINALSDILLLVPPAVMISRMKLQRKQKVALISIFGIGGIASVVSIVRGTIFFINRDHRLNEAYSNYLDIVLTATESSAGLMCACLPLMKPIVVRFTRWVQKLRGLDTKHHGWTTMDGTESQSMSTDPKIEKDKNIIRVDDYHIQLMPVSQISQSQSCSDDQGSMEVEKPWQSIGPYKTSAHCEATVPREPSSPVAAQWEVQNTRGHGKI